jgi:hypothetical protein
MAMIRQTRIFAPHDGLFSHERWAETVIGSIIKPVVNNFPDALEWYWFTRYTQLLNGDTGDCDFEKIPQDFIDPNGLNKSIRFRYAINDKTCEAFEVQCRQLVENAGCVITDFRPYSILDDLGGKNHLEEPRTPERIENRAKLVVANYHSIAALILDALIGPDEEGYFSLPHHHQVDPQQETPFHRLHHIFCNASDIPLYVSLIHNVPTGMQDKPRQEVKFHRVRF